MICAVPMMSPFGCTPTRELSRRAGRSRRHRASPGRSVERGATAICSPSSWRFVGAARSAGSKARPSTWFYTPSGVSSRLTGISGSTRRGVVQPRDRDDAAVPEDVLPDSGREGACLEVRHRACCGRVHPAGVAGVEDPRAVEGAVRRSICLVEMTESVASVSATTAGSATRHLAEERQRGPPAHRPRARRRAPDFAPRSPRRAARTESG